MPNKTCPKCNASKHVRVSKCDCGHSFYATKIEKVEEKTNAPTTAKSFLSIINKTESQTSSSSTIDHETPGRGKKQCPQCKKYIGGVLKICNLCQFNFDNKKEEIVQNEIKTFDGPGKGRKRCPQCKIYIGVRVTKCNCGFDFNSKSSEVKKSILLPAKSIQTITPVKPTFLTIINKVAEKEKSKLEKEDKKLTKFKMTGQGRKTCPDCKSIIPVATRTCECGHFFEKKEKSEPWLREEKPQYGGEFITYDIQNPNLSSIQISLENEIEREYLIEIKHERTLNCEEIDAELMFFDEQEQIRTKSPEEIVGFLQQKFKPDHISWRWFLSDEIFVEEQKIPQYLRYSRSNRKRYSTEYMWRDFKVARKRFFDENQYKDHVCLDTPKFRIEKNRIVILKEKSNFERQKWIMPKRG